MQSGLTILGLLQILVIKDTDGGLDNPNRCFYNLNQCYVDDGRFPPYNKIYRAPNLKYCMQACLRNTKRGLFAANPDTTIEQTSCKYLTFVKKTQDYGECFLYDQGKPVKGGWDCCYVVRSECLPPGKDCWKGPQNLEMVGHTIREFGTPNSTSSTLFDGTVEGCKKICLDDKTCRSLLFYPKDGGPAECLLESRRCSEPAMQSLCVPRQNVTYWEKTCTQDR